MLRTLVRRGARTTAAARASPRCLATVDATTEPTRLATRRRRLDGTRGGGGAGRGFATVDEATNKKKLDLSSHQLFGALGLQTFSKDELRKAFDRADLAANAVPEDERAGALALLRVCGDLGLLTGSAGFGALAAAAGSDAAFGAASVLLVATAVRFRLLAPSK